MSCPLQNFAQISVSLGFQLGPGVSRPAIPTYLMTPLVREEVSFSTGFSDGISLRFLGAAFPVPYEAERKPSVTANKLLSPYQVVYNIGVSVSIREIL